MNTPAHALINLALLGRATPPGAVAAVLAGGLLPDLPMLVFYAVQRLEGVPKRRSGPSATLPRSGRPSSMRRTHWC